MKNNDLSKDDRVDVPRHLKLEVDGLVDLTRAHCAVVASVLRNLSPDQ